MFSGFASVCHVVDPIDGSSASLVQFVYLLQLGLCSTLSYDYQHNNTHQQLANIHQQSLYNCTALKYFPGITHWLQLYFCFCTVLHLNALIWRWYAFYMPWSSNFGEEAIRFKVIFLRQWGRRHCLLTLPFILDTYFWWLNPGFICICKESKNIEKLMMRKVATNRKSKTQNQIWKTRLFNIVGVWLWSSKCFIKPYIFK